MEDHHQHLMARNCATVEELIREDRTITIDGIAKHIVINHRNAAKIVGELALQRLVPGELHDNLGNPQESPF